MTTASWPLTFAGLAQLVERWSHNPKVVSSILTPGNFAWMNSEGSGLGLQIQGGLTSQWFESTFCVPVFLFGEECVLDLSNIFTTLISVRGLVVMIVVTDPGSIPGERNFFLIVVWSTTNKIVRAMPMPLSRLAPKASALTTRPNLQPR